MGFFISKWQVFWNHATRDGIFLTPRFLSVVELLQRSILPDMLKWYNEPQINSVKEIAGLLCFSEECIIFVSRLR